MTRLFLLDDHQMVREGLRSVLQASGHVVVGDCDCAQGITDLLLSSQAEVLILDIHLESGSGLTVLQTLGDLKLPVRTVVLTMSAQPRHVSEALRLGALGYVLKGSPSSDLLQAIEAVSAGQKYLSKAVRALAQEPSANVVQGNPLGRLSVRELQILEMVIRGSTSATIAVSLSLSPKTVETYRSRLMTKLDIPDLPNLVRFAIRWGLLNVDADAPT